MNKLHNLEKDINWEEIRVRITGKLPLTLRNYTVGNLNAMNFIRLLYIQHLYKLNEMELEDKMIDRPSYRRFAGLRNADCPLYSKPLWEFRRRLEAENMLGSLLQEFESMLTHKHTEADRLRMAS